jgi:hypothetical protein
MIKIKAKPGIPRIKADGTGTIPLNTIIELNKSIFDYLASANFDKKILVVTISTEEDYPKLITSEAIDLNNKASIYSNEDE